MHCYEGAIAPLNETSHEIAPSTKPSRPDHCRERPNSFLAAFNYLHFLSPFPAIFCLNNLPTSDANREEVNKKMDETTLAGKCRKFPQAKRFPPQQQPKKKITAAQ